MENRPIKGRKYRWASSSPAERLHPHSDRRPNPKKAFTFTMAPSRKRPKKSDEGGFNSPTTDPIHRSSDSRRPTTIESEETTPTFQKPASSERKSRFQVIKTERNAARIRRGRFRSLSPIKSAPSSYCTFSTRKEGEVVDGRSVSFRRPLLDTASPGFDREALSPVGSAFKLVHTPEIEVELDDGRIIPIQPPSTRCISLVPSVDEQHQQISPERSEHLWTASKSGSSSGFSPDIQWKTAEKYNAYCERVQPLQGPVIDIFDTDSCIMAHSLAPFDVVRPRRIYQRKLFKQIVDRISRIEQTTSLMDAKIRNLEEKAKLFLDRI